MKDKFLHDNMSIKKTDRIIYGKCFILDWLEKIKNKTILFAKKNNKYEEKDLKKIARQLKKEKLRLKQKANKQKIYQ